jgi:hypothetical protein
MASTQRELINEAYGESREELRRLHEEEAKSNDPKMRAERRKRIDKLQQQAFAKAEAGNAGQVSPNELAATALLYRQSGADWPRIARHGCRLGAQAGFAAVNVGGGYKTYQLLHSKANGQ